MSRSRYNTKLTSGSLLWEFSTSLLPVLWESVSSFVKWRTLQLLPKVIVRSREFGLVHGMGHYSRNKHSTQDRVWPTLPSSTLQTNWCQVRGGARERPGHRQTGQCSFHYVFTDHLNILYNLVWEFGD